MDFDHQTNYDLGRSGGSRLGVPVTGDALQNIRNHASYEQGVNDAKWSSSGSDGVRFQSWSQFAGINGFLVFLIEAGALTWFVFAAFSIRILIAENRLPFTRDHHVLSDIVLSLVIYFGYLAISIFWCRISKWSAMIFFGVVYAIAGYWIVQHLNGNIYLQVGIPVVAALISAWLRSGVSSLF